MQELLGAGGGRDKHRVAQGATALQSGGEFIPPTTYDLPPTALLNTAGEYGYCR